MNKIQKAVRLEAWVVSAIEAYGSKNGMDFTEVVEFFLESELNIYDYFRKDYEPTRDRRKAVVPYEGDGQSIEENPTKAEGFPEEKTG
jgi:hypothetical protein